MSNLTEERKISEYAVNCTRFTREFKVATGKTIYKGAMVCLNNAYLAVPAVNLTATSHVMGIATNSAKEGEMVRVQTGFFALNNDTTSPVSAQHINLTIYVKDDNTVASIAGAGSVIAGKMRFIDLSTKQVVVELGNM